MSILGQILISLVSSATLISILAFVIKKYADKYITYYFDRRLGSQQMKDSLVAELKKEFFAKSIDVYSETSRLAFRCRLAGRSAVRELNENRTVSLRELWDAFQSFQRYLENQAFIDARDYRVIHAYKRRVEEFCALCQAYCDRKRETDTESQANEERRLTRFWSESVEPLFGEVEGVVRIFSVKDDA